MEINTSYIKVYKLTSGEFIISEIDTLSTDDENVVAILPAMIIPIPAQQGQQGQGIGFSKFVPFCDSSTHITIKREHVMLEVDPVKDFTNAYENWKKQVKQQESGIVMPNMHIDREQLEKFKKGVIDK